MVMERWRPRWGLRTWRPSTDIDELERRFDEMMGRPFSSLWRRGALERGWMPPIEMYEKDDHFMVRAELPGMKKDDIDISVMGDTLTIKGERKAEEEIKEEDYYFCERSYGNFQRSVTLPSAVDTKGIEAKFSDGVLEVSLPKSEEVKPKKVDIKPT